MESKNKMTAANRIKLDKSLLNKTPLAIESAKMEINKLVRQPEISKIKKCAGENRPAITFP